MNNNNDSLDTGIESEMSVICKFKRLCKGGKIPKNVKNIISTNSEIGYSFDTERGNESEDEFESSSDEISESEETENQSSSSSEEEKEENKSRELMEVFNSTVLNERNNESIISSGEKRKREITNQSKSLPKGWVYLSEEDKEEEKKEENTRKTRFGRKY